MSGSNPHMLSTAQILALKREAIEYRAAQRKALDALGVLWNAQLDLSVASGDTEQIRRALQRPVDFYDNCDCYSE